MVAPAASVKTFERYSRVLQCASRGQLTPATIDATLREFAIARGADYTKSLAKVAEEFVNGLINLVGDRSQTTGPPPEFFARLTRIYFDLLTRFADLQTTQIDDCLHALLDAAGDDAQSGALALRAPLGDTASSSLVVENTGSEPLMVACLATAVRRADGVGPAFSPALDVMPAQETLGPGEETSFRTSLHLEAGVYEPDVLYIGALRVMRQQSLHLEVPLHITATGSAI